MTAEQVTEHPVEGLRRNAVGLPDVIFTSVTTMAPAAGAAFSITVGALFAGGSLVLGVIIALAGCMFTALSIGQMARHLPSAGGMYTYIARGLGSKLGFLAGWGFDLAYPLVVPLVTILFGSILGSTLQAHFGYSYDLWWPIGMIFSLAAVGAANYFGIQVSTRFGILLGTFEILVMVALSLTLIVSAGSRNTLSVFTTHYATVPGFKGMSGVIAGSVYGVLAFIGFDAAAPLAEETRNATRNVSRAVVGSCLLVGLFYVLTTYAATVYFGAGRFVSFYTAGGGNPWHLMFPILGIVLFVPGFVAALGIELFKFVSPLTYPLNLAGIVIAVWYAIGVALVIYFTIRHPERIRDTAKVFVQDDAPELADASSA